MKHRLLLFLSMFLTGIPFPSKAQEESHAPALDSTVVINGDTTLHLDMRKDITTSSFGSFATLLIFVIAMIFANPIVAKGQECDSVVVVSAFDGLYIYPFISDERINQLVIQYGDGIQAIYPLLIVNNIVINDKAVVDHFRNSITLKDIKKWKMISKMRACKKGINNPPQDGVLMVTLKRKRFFEIATN